MRLKSTRSFGARNWEDAVLEADTIIAHEMPRKPQRDTRHSCRVMRRAVVWLCSGAAPILGFCAAYSEFGQDRNASNKSATSGPYAQFSLVACYVKGQGVPQDYAEAVKWFRKAAEQGDAGSQFGLGWCYAEREKCRRVWICPRCEC